MENFLTTSDVQKILGVSRPTLYRIMGAADFPKVRFGRAIRIPPDAFKRWVDAQTEPPHDC